MMAFVLSGIKAAGNAVCGNPVASGLKPLVEVKLLPGAGPDVPTRITSTPGWTDGIYGLDHIKLKH